MYSTRILPYSSGFIRVHPRASVVTTPASVFICVHQPAQSYLSANGANAIHDDDMQACALEPMRCETGAGSAWNPLEN